MKLILSFLLLFLIHCNSIAPWKSEWKTSDGSQYFIAAITAKASVKAIEAGSLAMRRTTCVDATNVLSTSPKLTATLVDYENMKLTESELKDLGRLIADYKIKPKAESCQSMTEESLLFSSPAWETCQCIYRIEYPGGRAQFQSDLTRIK